jgi:hypothetical protein
LAPGWSGCSDRQGSLVSGYTDRADLDLVLVWDQPAVPADREGLVAQLDQRQPATPFVVGFYYPGDKWLRQAIVRFGLDPRVLVAFDRVWERGMEPADQIEALSQLHSLLDEGG